MNKLALFVKQDRISKVLTQDAYAEEIGISTPTLSKIENGGFVKVVVLRKLGFYYKKDKRDLYKMMQEETDEDNK